MSSYYYYYHYYYYNYIDHHIALYCNVGAACIQSKEIPHRQETYRDPQAAVAEKAARVAAELRQKLERSSSEALGDGSRVVLSLFSQCTPRQFNEQIVKTCPKTTE